MGPVTIGSVLGGNVIASNGGAGLQINSTIGAPATIIANSIFANGGLGIDLLDGLGFGVTPNDPLDADGGPNGLQNFPAIVSVIVGASTTVQGTLDSKPSTSYALQFYASDVPDPSNYGEGQTYLGTTNVMTNGAGHASFTWNGPPVAAGRYLTATATGSEGTSEFSLAAVAQPATSGAVPTASTWALFLLFAALGTIAVLRMR